IGSAMGMSLLLGINPLFTILSGALMLGACFMATDMVTSPVAKTGRLVFAIGCGILTVLIRFYGYYDGGVTFSILAMNAVSYPLDSLLEGPHLGEVARRKKLYRKTAAISSVIIIFIVSIWASTLLTG
ncbi:MAG: RnfABCDGE type electron transport complex subunit D, partial [bacterium]